MTLPPRAKPSATKAASRQTAQANLPTVPPIEPAKGTKPTKKTQNNGAAGKSRSKAPLFSIAPKLSAKSNKADEAKHLAQKVIALEAKQKLAEEKVKAAEAREQAANEDFSILRTELQNQFVLNQTYKRVLTQNSVSRASVVTPSDVVSALKHSLLHGPRAILTDIRNLSALRSSPLFDAEFYRKAASLDRHTDAVRHYYYSGWKSDVDPSAIFSISRYRRRHADVGLQEVEPLSHFLRSGVKEGRDPMFEVVNISTNLSIASPSSGGVHDTSSKPLKPKHEWIIAQFPTAPEESLANYQHRPDDNVPRQALVGENFFRKFNLVDEEPDFAGAVAAIEPLLASKTGVDEPLVSIVIPVFGQLAYTLNTLQSLGLHASKHSFEIIVADDCSPDETETYLKDMVGIRFVRHSRNGGFIRNCNQAVDLARGQYLVLLNNDTRVVDGWLDELIDGFTHFPKAGLLGSKLFYPDGSLQEAGGIIWRDGSAWNYGRNDDPNCPEYCYARQVDFISGASIATPLSLWKQLGGFDELYCPAYYEDSDFAFRVREAGFETWFQPLSRVIHYEGKTSGTDLGSGVKAHQVTNGVKFYDRWKNVLATHANNGIAPERERDRYVGGKVLVLDATAPTPDQDAGSVTSVKVMQVFKELGFQVTFVPADNLLYQRRYIDDLQRIGIECLFAPYVPSLSAHLAEVGPSYDVVHVFRHQVMESARVGIRNMCPRAKLMFNNMDLHYLRVRRQGVIEQSEELIRLAEASKPHEIHTMSCSDYVFVPSSVEKDLLSLEDSLPTVQVMPFMVDPQEPIVHEVAPKDIMFLGGFDHRPNGDAVEWFVANVWPKLEKDARIGRFLIVGAKPSENIKAMANDRIIVTGRIEDLEPVFAQSRAMVVPLRYGAGVKGKIYTALAYGIPIIATGIGAEGIVGLKPDEHVLLAETADEFVEAINKVFVDDKLFDQMCAAGPRFIKEYATLEAGKRAMLEALDDLNVPMIARSSDAFRRPVRLGDVEVTYEPQKAFSQ
jgi:O-antigen biosynthesis protein